tara:strand:- start:1540 stop:4545 length:3006 start_codon:yes stop_codon:yes gene_type:complete
MSNARNIGDSAPVINFLDNVTSDIQTQLNTLDTAIGNVSVTSGSLTKTFAADEVATITLTGNVLAPVVTATKEVAQTGVTNNSWDAAAASYTFENSATATTLTPSAVGDGTFTLGSGSFTSDDVGKTISGNGGVAVLTSASGDYKVSTNFTNTNAIASGDWTMYAAVYNSTTDVIETSNFAQGYDISNITYNNVSGYVGSQASLLEGVFLKPDGTKMYVTGQNNDQISEYTLSTPNDPSTLTHVSSFSVSSQEAEPHGVFFKSDGTKVYLIGQSDASGAGSAVRAYDLSTAWQISTASYNSERTVLHSTDSYPKDLWISDDGTLLFWVGAQTNYIYKWTMSTAWDVSTATSTQSLNIGAKEAYPEGLALSSDGKNLFHMGNEYDKINRWAMSTAFDLSTAVWQEASELTEDSTPTSISFNSDGTTMLLAGGSNARVYGYSTKLLYAATGYQPAIGSTIDSTYWTDINSMTATNAVGDGNVFYALSADAKTSWNILSNGTGATFVVTVAGGKFVIDGVSQDSLTLQEGQTYIFDQADATNGTHPLRLSTTSDGTHGGGTEYTTGVTTSGTPGSSGAYTQIVVAVGAPTLYYYCSAHSGMGGTITIGVTGVRKIVKNNGGTYQVNTNSTYGSETWADAATNTEVAALQESMTSASSVSGQYDVSTATFVDYFSVSAVGSNSSYGFCFSATGHKMYVTSISLKSILEYGLSTNFDVSTASYTATFGVVGQDNSPADVQFNSDGTKMYVVGDSNNSVYEYALSTAWDVTSATLSSTFSIATYETDPWGLAFNSDGTKMFTIGVYGAVVEWALSTGFDISTASYTQNFATSGQLTYATGVEFNPDGTKMYVIDNGAQDVLTYTLTTGFDISTASFTARFLVTRGGLSKIRFNNDGTKMFLLNYSYLDVGEYTLGTTTYINQMTSTELNAINDASQITLGTALDLATILYYASGSNTPSYSGTALNYDANVLNQGAQLGVDYTYDAPAQNKVRVISNNAANLKIRVV